MKNSMYNKILVTHDGSTLASMAIPHAVYMASAFNAEVILLYAVNSVAQETAVLHTHALYQLAAFENMAIETVKRNKKYALKTLEKVKREFEKGGVQKITVRVEEGPAQDVIRDIAKLEQCDLIVMATHGRSGLKRVLIGSVADDTVRHAQCPVLVIPSHKKKSRRTSKKSKP
ncbi:MAG TPA: universal stress protein [Candidatus Levybacteria bacterium]|nr:universal stress protein [Candidatus Levybacteria bacterium]